MADYNVNMKQWNGTSFDNVLPLAYNAKQLDGQSLAEVKQWASESLGKVAFGSYSGTGVYGSAHINTLTFDFVPKVILIWEITESAGGSYGLQTTYPINSISSQITESYIYPSFNGQESGTITDKLMIPVSLLNSVSFLCIKHGTNTRYVADVYARINGNSVEWYASNGGDSAQMNKLYGYADNRIIPNYLYLAIG